MDLDNLDLGEQLQEPCTSQQRNEIHSLADTSVLNPDQKECYKRMAECNLTYLEAESLKEELREVQQSDIELARDGRAKSSQFNRALRKLVNMFNT
jgi:phosphoenolpyruvate carboxylase